MGFTVASKIKVATAEGPVTITTENIVEIQKAEDEGANVTFNENGESKTILTVASFLRVISYFSR